MSRSNHCSPMGGFSSLSTNRYISPLLFPIIATFCYSFAAKANIFIEIWFKSQYLYFQFPFFTLILVSWKFCIKLFFFKCLKKHRKKVKPTRHISECLLFVPSLGWPSITSFSDMSTFTSCLFTSTLYFIHNRGHRIWWVTDFRYLLALWSFWGVICTCERCHLNIGVGAIILVL